MRFHLLGQLQVLCDGRPVPAGPAKQRGLLAALLLEAGHVVSVDRLVASLWGDDPPASAVSNVRTYASRLRALLVDESGAARLEGRPPGYVLHVAEGELDLAEFRRLARQGRDALAAGDPARAAEDLEAALLLWRGAAGEDVGRCGHLDRRLAHLDEERLTLVEDWAEARLEAGTAPHLAADLRTLTADHPFRERLWGSLMLALYRGGDVLGALAAFGQARQVSVDALGVEPGPELTRLHRAVLVRDPVLAVHGGASADKDARSRLVVAILERLDETEISEIMARVSELRVGAGR